MSSYIFKILAVIKDIFLYLIVRFAFYVFYFFKICVWVKFSLYLDKEKINSKERI